MLGDAAGFILAGGQSSRMGTDKALAHFAGRPMIATAIATLAAAGLSARIAGSRSPLSVWAPVIPDSWPELRHSGESSAGPLAGVHAALSATLADWNLFLTVDTPLMPASLLTCLLKRAHLTGSPVTACSLNGRLEPFPVVLHRRSLPVIEAALQSGQRACRNAWHSICAQQAPSLQPVAVENLVQCGSLRHPDGFPPVFWFQSANTPEDLARLNRLASLGTSTKSE